MYKPRKIWTPLDECCKLLQKAPKWWYLSFEQYHCLHGRRLGTAAHVSLDGSSEKEIPRVTLGVDSVTVMFKATELLWNRLSLASSTIALSLTIEDKERVPSLISWFSISVKWLRKTVFGTSGLLSQVGTSPASAYISQLCMRQMTKQDERRLRAAFAICNRSWDTTQVHIILELPWV